MQMFYDSPLGRLTLVSDGNALTGLYMEGQAHFLVLAEEIGQDNILRAAENWLSEYFAGSIPKALPCPLAPEGTAFQKQVWEILLTVPYGKTMTYGQIAKIMASRLGKANMSAQAVGNAVGKNPISILIPCHRVVGSSGQLTGYAGGLDRKQWLLTHEQGFDSK